jgi:hypothetical protein
MEYFDANMLLLSATPPIPAPIITSNMGKLSICNEFILAFHYAEPLQLKQTYKWALGRWVALPMA